MTIAVLLDDVGETLGRRNRGSVRSSREIAVRQCVGDLGPLLRKPLERREKATLLGLGSRTGVVGDEARQPRTSGALQEGRSVRGMEACADKTRRIADVVEIRSGQDDPKIVGSSRSLRPRARSTTPSVCAQR